MDSQPINGVLPKPIREAELLKYRRKFKGPGVSCSDAAGRKTSQSYRGMLGTLPALRRITSPVSEEANNSKPQRRLFTQPKTELFDWRLCTEKEASFENETTRNFDLPNKQHKLTGTGVVVEQELTTTKFTKRFGYPLTNTGIDSGARIIPSQSIRRYRLDSIECIEEEGNCESVGFVKRVHLEQPPSHPEVINYRFSGGICPPYKFIDTTAFGAAQARP